MPHPSEAGRGRFGSTSPKPAEADRGNVPTNQLQVISALRQRACRRQTRLTQTSNIMSTAGNTFFPARFAGFGAIMPKEAAILYPYERAARQAAAMRAGNHAPKEREA